MLEGAATSLLLDIRLQATLDIERTANSEVLIITDIPNLGKDSHLL